MKSIPAILLVASLLAVALTACTNPIAVDTKQAKEAMSMITYTKDSRTNLCFAILGSLGTDGFAKQSITYVPCSPEVLALVK